VDLARTFLAAAGQDLLGVMTGVDRRYEITVYRTGADGELFDLATDPGEVRNLWGDPAAGDLKARLLHEFIQATLAAEPTRMRRIAGA